MANVTDYINKIKTAVFGKEVRGSLADGLDVVNKEVEGTTKKQKNLELTFNELTINAGNSNAEIVDARVDKVNSQSYNKLGDRLDGISSSLETVKTDIFSSNINASRKIRPIMSIIDDDGNPKVLERLKPLLIKYKVPIISALVIDRVGVDNSMSMNEEQIKELHGLGMEFVSHTATHQRMADMTAEQVEYEAISSKKWLMEHGYNYKALVYPFGSYSDSVKNILGKYFDIAIDIDVMDKALLNNSPLKNYELKRVYIENHAIEVLKAKIDEAITNNSWIIFGMHCWMAEWNNGMEKLDQLIQYAKDKIEIVTCENAINTYCNAVTVGVPSQVDKGEDFIGIDAEGVCHGGRIGVYTHTNMNKYSVTTPLTDFPKNKITSGYILSANAVSGGFPENKMGIFTVHRFMNDIFGYRTYKIYDSNKVYYSEWNNETKVWNDFYYQDKLNNINFSQNIDIGVVGANSYKDIEIVNPLIPFYPVLTCGFKGKLNPPLVHSIQYVEKGKAILRIINNGATQIDGKTIECKIFIIK